MKSPESRFPGLKRRRLAIAALLLLAAMPLAAEGADRDEFKRTFEKTVALRSGQKLRIEHANGKIEVRTRREPQVSISATIRVSSSDVEGARQFSEQIRIDVEESPSGVAVVTRYPEKKWSFSGRGFVSYSVDYDIVMPETAPLEVRNRVGNVEVQGL